MKRSDKFRQANQEAKATVLATAAVIVFWTVAGFGLSGSEIKILSTPIWVWMGCVGSWVFACLVAVYLANFVCKDMSFDDEDEEA